MERRGLDLPLLIGGATTSKQHTAVKIAPAYSRAVVHVLDASRVVGVVSDLLDADAPRARSTPTTASSRSACASSTPRSTRKPLLPLERGARERASASPSTSCRSRRSPGARTRRARSRRRSARYIDWQFFFHAWELKGKFPAILERPEARSLFDDATELLDEIVARKLLQAARRVRLLARGGRRRRHRRSTSTRFSMLRQQSAYGDSRPNRSLADYVAPDGRPHRRLRGRRPRRRRARRALRGRARRLPRDHGQGARRPARRGVRGVAARAGAPRVVRDAARALERGADRASGSAGSGRRSATRPAPTTPRSASSSTCSAPSEAGLALTETLRDDARPPRSAGIYLHHPQARYFSVGRDRRATRSPTTRAQGRSTLAEVERWLRPNLGYEPETADLVTA